ncbi:hypothetical protein F4805DRAFT_367041 [Annulohypoxylon moriforme]|nr:hypothetical protein F4805DRAFT_367041 [Annulohypoxylon moriforme]
MDTTTSSNAERSSHMALVYARLFKSRPSARKIQKRNSLPTKSTEQKSVNSSSSAVRSDVVGVPQHQNRANQIQATDSNFRTLSPVSACEPYLLSRGFYSQLVSSISKVGRSTLPFTNVTAEIRHSMSDTVLLYPHNSYHNTYNACIPAWRHALLNYFSAPEVMYSDSSGIFQGQMYFVRGRLISTAMRYAKIASYHLPTA